MSIPEIVRKLGAEHSIEEWKIGYSPDPSVADKNNREVLSSEYVENVKMNITFFKHSDEELKSVPEDEV